MEENLTPEELANRYSSTMDSVNVINEFIVKTPLTQEDKNTIDRNVEHLKIMISKDFWTEDHDLTPFKTAIADGEAASVSVE
jgi:hypothetical protein